MPRLKMERCPNPNKGCKYDPPFADDHHEVWPACEYTTPLEKRYRNLEVNIVRGICRCMHDLEHLKQKPPKPSVAKMKEAIDLSKI